MDRNGLKVSKRPKDGTYEWINRRTGEIIDVPTGIDPGWDYNPGKTAWGQKLSDEIMSTWRKQGAGAFERLTPGTWKTFGLPKALPSTLAKARPDYSIPRTRQGIEDYLTDNYGEEKVFSFIDREYPTFRHDVHVSTHILATHLDPQRAPFLPLLEETLTTPDEIWMAFEMHKGTGQVFLRQRVIKAVEVDKGMSMLVVTQAVNGRLEAWTLLPSSDITYINKQRVGSLIWKKD